MDVYTTVHVYTNTCTYVWCLRTMNMVPFISIGFQVNHIFKFRLYIFSDDWSINGFLLSETLSLAIKRLARPIE